MTDIPQLGAVSLTASIDDAIAKLKQMRLPSLRTVHSARQQVVRLDFERDREEQLRLRVANGRPALPGHHEVAESWIEMLQSVLKPAELLRLNAKVVPSKKGVALESPAFFAATVLAVSTWPVNLPFPEETDLYAVLTLKLRKEQGEMVGDVWVDIGATKGSAQELDALSAYMPSLAQDRGYYWQRCCHRLTPWLADGGITDLSILVPMRPAGEPFDLSAPRGTATVH